MISGEFKDFEHVLAGNLTNVESICQHILLALTNYEGQLPSHWQAFKSRLDRRCLLLCTFGIGSQIVRRRTNTMFAELQSRFDTLAQIPFALFANSNLVRI